MSFLYPLATISFKYPYLLFFPILLYLAAKLESNSSESIKISYLGDAKELPKSFREIFRKPVLNTLYCIFIGCLTIAAARPYKIDADYDLNKSTNIILALDISKSMSINDYVADFGQISRLEAVKIVVNEFIESRVNDRIGVVVFGTSALLQAPLTRDHSILQFLVNKLRVGLAGDGTAIGDGLGLSLKRIKDLDGDSKAIVLLTDGVSNSGKVNPLQAANLASELGIKVHTIGLGSDQDSSRSGMFNNFFSGQMMGDEFDEKVLKEIANISGGVYFHAKNLQELKKIYSEIDRLETTTSDDFVKRKIDELFWGYSLASLLAYLLYMLLAKTIFLKLP